MAKSGVVKLEKKLQKTPGLPGFAWVGAQYVLHGNIPHGLELLRTNAEAAPDDLEGLLALGRAEQLEANFDRARACFEKATEIDPGAPGAWAGLYEVANAMGETDLARRAATAWRELDPFALGELEGSEEEIDQVDEAGLEAALAPEAAAEGATDLAGFGNSELEVPFDQVASLLDQVPGGEASDADLRMPDFGDSLGEGAEGKAEDEEELTLGAPAAETSAEEPAAEASAESAAPAEASAEAAPAAEGAAPKGGAAFVVEGDDVAEENYTSPVTGSDVSSAIDDLFGDEATDDDLMKGLSENATPESVMPQDSEVNQQLGALFAEEEEEEAAAAHAEAEQDLDALAASFGASDAKPEAKAEEPVGSDDAPAAETVVEAPEKGMDDLLADLDSAFGEVKTEEPAAEAASEAAPAEPAPEASAEEPGKAMDDLLGDLDAAFGEAKTEEPAAEAAPEAASASEPAPEAQAAEAAEAPSDDFSGLDDLLGDDSAPAFQPEEPAESAADAADDDLSDILGEAADLGAGAPAEEATPAADGTDALAADLDALGDILSAPQESVSLDAPASSSDDDLSGLDSIFEVDESPEIVDPSAAAAPAPEAQAAEAAEPKDELGDAVADELGSLLGDDDEEGDFKLESAAEAALGDDASGSPAPEPEPAAPAAEAAEPEPADDGGAASADGASDDGFLPETGTMAEIYAGQGHYEQAIRIYRDKLERDPSDERAAKRIAELEELLRRKKEGE